MKPFCDFLRENFQIETFFCQFSGLSAHFGSLFRMFGEISYGIPPTGNVAIRDSYADTFPVYVESEIRIA